MTHPIDRLVADLRDALQQCTFKTSESQGVSSGSNGGPARLLADYARQHEDWRRFAHFEDDAYTRNLIETNEDFELILLCWSSDQRSPVHNHEGQNCWMAVLDGTMEEERFEEPTSPGPLVSRDRQSFAPGDVAFIRDEIGLHVVRPTGGAPSVSLHLYAAPIPECNCYCEETGAVSRRRMSFHTLRGEPAGG